MAHRRSAILVAVVINFLAFGERPTTSVQQSTVLVSIGAVMMGVESFSVEMAGLVLTWAFNVSQSVQSTYTAKLN